MASAEADLRARMERLRDHLESRLDGATDRDLAALAARYEAVLEKLAAMPDPNAAADRVETAQADDAVLRLVR